MSNDDNNWTPPEIFESHPRKIRPEVVRAREAELRKKLSQNLEETTEEIRHERLSRDRLRRLLRIRLR